MTEPTNPYESPADGDASREISRGWISIKTYRVLHWPVSLVVLMFLTMILLVMFMVVAYLLVVVVGQIGNLLMIVPLLIAGFALLTNTKRIMSRYD